TRYHGQNGWRRSYCAGLNPPRHRLRACLFFFNERAPTEIYPLSLHDALPIYLPHIARRRLPSKPPLVAARARTPRSEEHTSELQSHLNLVCRLLLEKKKN